MTKINFKRAGGLTGREVETDLDLNELPADEAQELMQLLTASNFFTIPQNLIAPGVTPDEYEYTITVDAGNTHHEIHTTDSSTPESLRPLLQKLTGLMRAKGSEV